MGVLLLLYQSGSNPMIGIDPTPFTAWGVLGLLGVSLLVFLGIIWRLFMKATSAMETQTQGLIAFVNVHRAETTKALGDLADKNNQTMVGVADKLVISQERMTSAFAKVARVIDELVLLERIYDRASKRRSDTTPLTDDEIEKIVRTVRSNRDVKE